ncbi:MAG: DUF859 family phage minor structural protein [Chloroflexota bacterium]|nr:DUF859 family phage minor structural protein [Chloroflexota bacterium]
MADPLTLKGAISNTEMIISRRVATYASPDRALSHTSPSGYYIEPQTVLAYGDGGFTAYSQWWPAVPVRFNFPGDSGYWQWSWINSDDNLPLYTPTSPTLDNFTALNSAYSIPLQLTAEQEGNTHDVTLYYGETVIKTATGLGDITSWALELADAQALLAAMSTVTSGTVRVRVVTKRGADTVGAKETTAVATIDGNIRPSIGSFTAQEAAQAVLSAGIGGYVQHQSQIKLTMSGITPGQGASITARKITFLSQTWSTETATTAKVPQSGTLTATAEVTDSRNRKATKTVSVEVLPWQAPRLTVSNIRRASDTSGTLDDAGEYARVDRTITVSPLTVGDRRRNRLRLVIRRSPAGAEDWTIIYIYSWPNTQPATNAGMTVPNATLSASKSWDIEVLLYDSFTSTSHKRTLTAAGCAFSIYKNIGIAVGKVAEVTAALDVNSAHGLAVDGQKVTKAWHVIKFLGGTV